MKTLNKTAAATFNALINSIKEGETHVKIDNTNGTFMPVSFELLYSDLMGKTQVNVYAMAHYYEQNGDLIADPDMTFAVDQNNPYFIVPMSFQDYRTYEASIVNDSDGIKIRMKMQADHTKFANQWLANIKSQQGLKAVKPATTPEPEPTPPAPAPKSHKEFNIGDHVKFIDLPETVNGENNPLIDKIGIVVHSQKNDVNVLIEKFGCIGFLPENLEKIEKPAEPTPPAPDPEPETKQPAAKFSPGEKVYLADDCSTYYTVENSKINENKERFYTINGNGRTEYSVPESDVLKITTDMKTGDQVTITGREFITGGKGKGKKNPYFGKRGTVSHIDGVHIFVNLQMSKTETICAGFTPEKVFLLQRAEATAPAPAPEPTPAPVAIQAPRTAKKDRPARRPKPAKQKLTEIYSDFCSFVDGYFVSTSLAY